MQASAQKEINFPRLAKQIMRLTQRRIQLTLAFRRNPVMFIRTKYLNKYNTPHCVHTHTAL